MSSGTTPAKQASERAAASAGTWKLMAYVLVGLVVLVGLGVTALFVVYDGRLGDGDPAADEEALPGLPPLPPPRHEDVLEEARGIYMLETASARFTLELRGGSRFQFISQKGKEVRMAEGTWNLVGPRLTLDYETVNGQPFKGKPFVNVYRRDAVELLYPGQKERIVLRKRTMLRER